MQDVFDKLGCKVELPPPPGSAGRVDAGREEKGRDGTKKASGVIKNQSSKKAGVLKASSMRKLSVSSQETMLRMSIAQGVDESNLMVCLGIIEQKACEIVNEYKAAKLREKQRQHKAGGHGSAFNSSSNILKSSNMDAMLSPSGPSHPRRREHKPHVEVPDSLVGSVADAKGFSYDEHEVDDDDFDGDDGLVEKPIFSTDIKQQMLSKASSHGHGHGGHGHSGHHHGAHHGAESTRRRSNFTIAGAH